MKHLTLKSFAEVAEKAIADKKLAIQHEDGLMAYLAENAGANCLNTYPPKYFGGQVCHCIIGTALDMGPKDRYVDIGIGDALHVCVASFDEEFTKDELHLLQSRHDTVVTRLRTVLRESHPLSDTRKEAMADWRKQRDDFLARVETFIAKHKEAA